MVSRLIRNATVIGSGVMGSQIAALIASAGIPVNLLDIVPSDLKNDEPRNKLAASAIDRMKKAMPSPAMHQASFKLIKPGNLEDDIRELRDSDWILEAVVERLDVKQELWRTVAKYARPDTILSTNTSGLSCAEQASALPSENRRNFLGTHFFNPPRYLKLLELIPLPETDPEVLSLMRQFGERNLGKGVVICSDTPNFIANRVGTYGLAVTLQAMDDLGLTVDEVDAITGTALGRPKSATFRTLDLVGLDTFYHVASNLASATNDPEERDLMTTPGYIDALMARGWLGEKSGHGFYKKVKGAGGVSQILTIDLQDMTYRPKQEPVFESIEATRRIKESGQRIKALLEYDDPAAQFAWKTMGRLLSFCARKLGEIAGGDVNALDRAMRWGYNWELGPFETWNVLGVQPVAERMREDGLELPDWIAGVEYFPVDRVHESPLSFTELRHEKTRIVKQTAGLTLFDLGDEVLGLELHGPKQSIGDDYMPGIRAVAEEVLRNWRGLVVSASATNFCVGANLMMVVLAAQAQHWELLEKACKGLQDANMTLKYLARPVVVAPYGVTVGGGAEIAMHCARTVAAAETYMGLVEAGVGIIPAGGGTKEMALRAAAVLPQTTSQLPNRPELISFLGPVFETIATARTSTSAAEARDLGYLRATDSIVMNGDHLLQEAKEAVLALDAEAYVAPTPQEFPIAGPDGRAVLELAVSTLRNGGFATDYDAFIAKKLAYVITGGMLPQNSLVPEQYILDLEREAFLQLVGEPKTQERMTHMLRHSKPLRN